MVRQSHRPHHAGLAGAVLPCHPLGSRPRRTRPSRPPVRRLVSQAAPDVQRRPRRCAPTTLGGRTFSGFRPMPGHGKNPRSARSTPARRGMLPRLSIPTRKQNPTGFAQSRAELLSLKSFADLEFDTESRYLALLGTDGLMMIYDIENKVPSPLVNLATSMSEPLSSELPGSIAPSIHSDTVAGKDVGSPYLFSALGSNKTGGFVVASF